MRSISMKTTTRARINRANAKQSTGPKTKAGKKRSSLNALRHGLTGQAIVLPSDDLKAYQKHLQSFADEYRPQGATEPIWSNPSPTPPGVRTASLRSNPEPSPKPPLSTARREP
jgi:hypothetical protein